MTRASRSNSLDACFQGAADLGLPLYVSMAIAMVFASAMLRTVSSFTPTSKVTCAEGQYDWCNLRQDIRALISFGLGALMCGWARWK
ncbi:unnamed protein product, partial [Effrenium voratum]